MKTRQRETAIVAAELERPSEGPTWKPDAKLGGLSISGKPAWQSHGGPSRGHPARSFPFSFEVRLPEHHGQLLRVYLVGIFALYADVRSEGLGTMGATVQLLAGDREIAARYDLLYGRHYGDPSNLVAINRVVGDGTSIENVGTCKYRGEKYRVDVLTLDVPLGIRPRRLYFNDLGSSASFVIFDAFFEFSGEPREDTPDGRVVLSLSDLGAAIRVGDRVKFARAIQQLDDALDEAEDLNEARDLALTFLGVVSAALIETSTSYDSTGLLLETARQLDTLQSRSQVREAIRERISEVTEGFFAPSDSPSDRLVDRALAIVERHFAKDLTDAMVAAQLGLSTSHFRFLFRQATGHPFHKYVVGLRLEKAKQMLIEQEMPVSQIATAVGFTGLSHFSRAFTQRFSASPSHIRRAAG
jgi:AraC-like DNA-binding protein